MHQENELFGAEEFFQKDESPLENVHITTTILYFSSDELKEFKSICKSLMKKKFPLNYQDSNISDLILKILRDEFKNGRGV